MEKESIVLRISKHNFYRGIKIALSLAVFIYFSYSLWNKYEYGSSDDTVYLLFIAGSGAALALAVLLGFCFGCFDTKDDWDRKKLLLGQGYMFAGAVIVQIMMYLILYSIFYGKFPLGLGEIWGVFFQGLLGSDAGCLAGIGFPCI